VTPLGCPPRPSFARLGVGPRLGPGALVLPGDPEAARVALEAQDIRVYTHAMRIVKVRRVGNSNVVSIPREFEAHGYEPGTSVLVEEFDGGELRIMPTDQLRERIRTIGERVVAEHPEALKILAEHDPGSKPTPR
jgi:antitoxin component of MazEF toxin-antitoxin module